MTKIEMGKKYRYRDGREARVICIDRANSDGRSVISLTPSGSVIAHMENGETGLGFGDQDLIEVVEPVMVPLEASDIQPSFRFTKKNGAMNYWQSAIFASIESLSIGGYSVTYDSLRKLYYVDRNDGKGWVACEKEQKAATA